MATINGLFLCAGSLDDVFDPCNPSEFRQEMGIDLSLGGLDFTPEISILCMIRVTAVFFVIAVMRIKKK